MSDRHCLYTLFGLIGAAWLLGMYLFIHWPLYTFSTLIFLFVGVSLWNYLQLWRVFTILETNGYEEIQPETSAEYTGIYRPDSELGDIQIPLAKRRLWVIPIVESWSPYSAPNITERLHALDESSEPFIVTFIGTPSPRGHDESLESRDREVRIEKLINISRLPEQLV